MPTDKPARKPLPSGRPASGSIASGRNNQPTMPVSAGTPPRPGRGNTGDLVQQISTSRRRSTSTSTDGSGQASDDDLVAISPAQASSSDLTADARNKSQVPQLKGASALTASRKRDHDTMANPSAHANHVGANTAVQTFSASRTGDPSQQPSQQPLQQQPRGAKVPCPVHDCQFLLQPRMDHLYDHLAENHGYERAAREYTVDLKHIKRKTVPTLRALFIRDTRKLAWAKARLLAAEEAIGQADPSYVSGHGLGLTMDAYSIPEATACAGSKKKEPLKAMLIAARGEMAQRGRLRNQVGVAQSSWAQVLDDLVSTFHLARNAVDQRAEQYFQQLRVAVGDDMAQGVTPAQVELTHQLQLKAGASLPPK
ncbi:hypothetical protein KVR01_012937 [Diaporthe batatas]|uniref:uncharacterized protein n=1 Tax=Diaporthe batatas TaxID=748121 RepID=UPI001D05BD77|nr:uncharacterized protein KVR01_012937 [Diaporthe batatas]KAG8157229.1 hypothetical protein KVR01_012937 [Diaporthe batatas]